MVFRRYQKKNVRRTRKTRKMSRMQGRRYYSRSLTALNNRPTIVRKQALFPQIVGSAAGIADLLSSPTYSAVLTNFTNQYDLDALSGQFEQMKVLKLILELEPLQSEAVQSFPNAYIRKVVDNQVAGYTTEAQYLANQDCKSMSVVGRRVLRFVIYPKMELNEVFGTTTVIRYRNPGYFNTSQSSAGLVFSMVRPHIFIPPMTVGVSLFNVRCTAIIAYKGNK